MADKNDIPLFTLLRFNPRRASRGAEAAEVEATWADGETEVLWMSKQDILQNIAKFGEQAGLTNALNKYSKIGC